MNREDLEKLLEHQITPDAPKPVHLPSISQTLYIRRLTAAERMQASAMAYHPDSGERQARSIAAGIRYAAVDDTGEHLFRGFEEALHFLAVLDASDFEELGKVMNALFSDDNEVADLEQAKNS